jgi:lysophospholipase L1-like esterase
MSKIIVANKLKTVIFGVTVTFIAILASLVFVEFSCRLLDLISPPMPRSWKDISFTSPPSPPYQRADYDVKQLSVERNNVNWASDELYGYRAADTKGIYINILDGIRKTTGVPANPKHKVWIFGGSTIMCQEVPDRYTVPSQIQRILNEKYPGIYKVINLGATSLTTRHQLWRLNNDAKDIGLGDIVIFYDGVNDIIQSLYYKNPTGTMAGANRIKIDEGGLSRKLIFALYGRFGEYSAFVRRFLYPFSPEERGVEFSHELVTQMQKTYVANIAAASDYARTRGAVFYHFLQPSLYSVQPLSQWEQSLLSNGWLYPLELNKVYSIGYPALREANAELSTRGINSVDLTDALNNKTSDIFLDGFHVNEFGNAMIGKAIMQIVNVNYE